MPLRPSLADSKMLLAFTVTLVSWSMLFGCSKDPRLAPTAGEILTVFEASLPGTPPDPVKPPLNLYIDSSMSMRGFATDPQSTYVRTVQQVWRQAVLAQYKLNAWRFSGEFSALNSTNSSRLAAPDFYNGLDTHLTALLTRLTADIDQGEVVAVVSDLVQSEAGRNELDLVKELLTTLSEKHPEVLLLGLRSSFRGAYFVETGSKGTFQLNLAEGPPGKGRPFYLLVFAPSQAALETFQKYVLAGLGEEVSFQPTLAPLTVRAVEYVPASGDAQVWQRYQKLEPVPGSSAPSGFIERFFEIRPPVGPSSAFQLKFSTQPHFPIIDASRFRWRVKKTSFDRGNNAQRPTAVDRLQLSAQGTEDGSMFTITYSALPRPAPDTWDVYRVQIQAGAGNLGVPVWVRQWSTPTDQSQATGDRTLHLDVFLEAMLRAITENVIFSDHYIAFGRGAT